MRFDVKKQATTWISFFSRNNARLIPCRKLEYHVRLAQDAAMYKHSTKLNQVAFELTGIDNCASFAVR